MSGRYTFHIDMSYSDLVCLELALHSAISNKRAILDYPDSLTPKTPLREDIDTLERLLHIFKTSGEPYAGD